MSKVQKDKTQEPTHVSHWEELWEEADYREHEVEFQKMLIKYRELREKCQGNPIEARWRWLEKQGAVKIVKTGIQVRPNCYAMYDAQFGKFTEWLSRQEKTSPDFEKMKREAWARVGKAIPKKVDPEIESLEKLAVESIYDDKKLEFNGIEI